MTTTGTSIATNKLKLTWLESFGTLNFIAWKEKDHITQEGNAKIQPSYAFQCFSSGVEVRIFIQFGTGSQQFLKT